MPCRNKLFPSLLLMALVGASVHADLPEAAFTVPSAAAGSVRPSAYADAGQLLWGAAMGTLNLRLGFELPLAAAWSWSVEGAVYWTSPDGESILQADAHGALRYRPRAWVYFGAGAGPAVTLLKSGDSDSSYLGVLGFVEAGLRTRLFASPWYAEPYLRPYAAAAFNLDDGDWSAPAGLSAGLRIGRNF